MINFSPLIAATFSIIVGSAAAAPPVFDFPAPGRTFDMIVPFGAGGPTDVAARLLVPALEEELGAPVTVINRPGASTQIGVTVLSRSKPDGYTFGFVSLPQLITVYADPQRQAVFGRADLQPLAMHVVDPIVVAVRADSPYKTMADLLADVKARPGKVKGGTGGFMGTPHLAYLEIERLANVKFALVNFEGSAPGNTALLGGHIDLLVDTVAGTFTKARAGTIRVLGIADDEQSPFLPGVKTLKEQGLDMKFAASRGLVAPAGTPEPAVARLSGALQKAINSEDHRKRMGDLGQTLRYLDPQAFSAYWQAAEVQVKPLMENARRSVAQ